MQEKTYILTGTEQISAGGMLSGRSFAQSTEAQKRKEEIIKEVEIIKEADRKTSSRNIAKSQLHPMHGALKKIIQVRLPNGSLKFMKVKTALQKGFIKSQ